MPIDRDWTRREILKTAAAGSLAGRCESCRLSRIEPAAADPERIRRENEHARHPRLDDDQRPHRSPDQVPQPMDRRLRLEDEREARRDDLDSRQHQSRLSVH